MSHEKNALNADQLQSISGGYRSITQQISLLDSKLLTGNKQAYFAGLKRTVDTLNSALPVDYLGGIRWPVNGPDPVPFS